MRLPCGNLPAEIEAANVVAQLGNSRRCAVEVVTSIEGVVAEEFPTRSVELFAPRFDYRRNGGGGGETIFSAVVRRDVTELGQGVNRRHYAAAAAAAVKVFAAIE